MALHVLHMCRLVQGEGFLHPYTAEKGQCLLLLETIHTQHKRRQQVRPVYLSFVIYAPHTWHLREVFAHSTINSADDRSTFVRLLSPQQCAAGVTIFSAVQPRAREPRKGVYGSWYREPNSISLRKHTLLFAYTVNEGFAFAAVYTHKSEKIKITCTHSTLSLSRWCRRALFNRNQKPFRMCTYIRDRDFLEDLLKGLVFWIRSRFTYTQLTVLIDSLLPEAFARATDEAIRIHEKYEELSYIEIFPTLYKYRWSTEHVLCCSTWNGGWDLKSAPKARR